MIKTNKIAGGGVCAALCLILLLASSFIPVRIALLFATSIVMGICLLRYKTLTAILTYVSVSLISILILPKANQLMPWCFVAVFGIYPIFKLYIEKIKNITIEYIIKFFVWNIHMFAMYVILSAFGQNSLFDLGTFWIWIAGIAVMLTYDLAFGIFINGFYRTYYKFLK
ncbi:MAG: hypothetical protein J6B23_09850 [Clostridia bacterium]|nr:hypothetical protein [Clostridia bacterium]